jgi:hypothetical protein
MIQEKNSLIMILENQLVGKVNSQMNKFVTTYNIVHSPCINVVRIAEWNWK